MKKSTIFGLALGMMSVASLSANAAYELNPASGSVVTRMGSITINFTDTPVFFDTEAGTPVAKVQNLNVPEKIFECQTPLVNEDGYSYTLNFKNPDGWDYPTNEAGIYRLTITNMYQTIEGEKVAAEDIVASYTVEYGYEYVLNPSVDNAKDLQNLQLIFPNMDVDFPTGSRTAYATLNGPRTTYECASLPKREYNEAIGTTFTFTFSISGDADDTVPESITAPGTYYLTVQGPTIGMVDGQLTDNSRPMPRFYAIYIISEDSSSQPGEDIFYMEEAVMTEPNSSYVSSVGQLTLTYGGSPIELVSPSEDENDTGFKYSTIPATLAIEGDDTTYELYPYIMSTLAGGNDPGIMPWAEEGDDEDDMETEYILIIPLGQLLEDFSWVLPAGEYVVSLPEGIIKDEAGAVNPAQTFSFYVLRSSDFGTVTPPDYDYDNWEPFEYEASELTAVTVDWDAASLTKIEGSEDVTLAEDAFMSTTPATPLLYGQEVKIEDNKLVINLSKVDKGAWQVNIPEGYVIIDGTKINSDQILNFTIIATDSSSVISLDANEEGKYVVYNLNGVNVLNTENVNDIRNLDAGLYIINGKKVIVRK